MADDDMFRPIGGGERHPGRGRAHGSSGGPRRNTGEWIPLSPVPDDAPAPPVDHPTRGAPAAVYEYRNAAGALVALTRRFDKPDGEKDFLPLSYCRHSRTGALEWRTKAPAQPRPIYGAERLAERPGTAVLVVEGEKAANAASRLLPDHVGVTSWGGSKAAGKANWGSLARRDVTIWPDADETGQDYARAAARCLTLVSASVKIIDPPAGVATGWDAADAEAEGWTPERAAELVANAVRADDALSDAAVAPGADGQSGESSDRKGRRRNRDDGGGSQKDFLVTIAEGAALWHTPDKDAYASFPVADHVENAPVRGKPFRHWIVNRYFEAMGNGPGSQATEDALRVIEARAIYHGPEHVAYRRVAGAADAIYIDLGGPDWRAIEVNATRWCVIDRPPVKFIRNKAMRALPVPEINDSESGIRLLGDFINLETEGDFKLLVSWLLASLAPSGPYPILIFTGQQGSAKSTATRIARDLVDPNQSPIRAMPRDDRDLMVTAINNHALAFDNVSSIAPWLSDGLCRIATGGGYATRELHSDMDEVVMDAMRPIALNGITDLVSRPDLGERAIVLDLPAIPSENRRSEAEFRCDYERARPLILGALLDGLVSALKNRGSVRLDRPPRLADYGLWATAAEPGLGWRSGSVVEAYWDNRESAIRIEFENDDVAQAVKALLSQGGAWSGSATELKEALDALVSESTRKLRSWPKTAATLGGRLKRLIPTLRGVGMSAKHDRAPGGGRRWIIETVAS